MSSLRPILAALIVLPLAANVAAQTDCTPDTDDPQARGAIVTWDGTCGVYEQVFKPTPGCANAGCHTDPSPDGDLDLSSYDEFISSYTTCLNRDCACHVFARIEVGTMPEPMSATHPTGYSITDVQREQFEVLITEWIQDSAPNGYTCPQPRPVENHPRRNAPPVIVEPAIDGCSGDNCILADTTPTFSARINDSGAEAAYELSYGLVDDVGANTIEVEDSDTCGGGLNLETIAVETSDDSLTCGTQYEYQFSGTNYDLENCVFPLPADADDPRTSAAGPLSFATRDCELNSIGPQFAARDTEFSFQTTIAGGFSRPETTSFQLSSVPELLNNDNIDDDGLITWTPPDESPAQVTASVQISGPDSNSDPETFTICITNTDTGVLAPLLTPFDPDPVIELDKLTDSASDHFCDPTDSTEAITWSLLQPDGGQIACGEPSVEPAGMVIACDGEITWTPATCSAGSHEFTVQAEVEVSEEDTILLSQPLNVTVEARDGDMDSVFDCDDNCPDDPNPDQADFDCGMGQAGCEFDMGGDVCDLDDDNDSIHDSAEIGNFLDPFDPADAEQDLDSDGISNADEFAACAANEDFECSAISTNLIPLTVVSTGYLTDVNFSSDTFDALDPDSRFSTDPSGPFRPGRHQIAFTSIDSDGPETVIMRILDVLPLVTLAGSVTTGEGRTVKVPVVLNGVAPGSVTLAYAADDDEGSADNTDYSLADDTTLEIATGETTAMIPVDIAADGVAEGDETLVIALTAVSEFAALSDAVAYDILIVERNVAPTVSLTVQQADRSSFFVYKTEDDGVTINANGVDPNEDPLTYDWLMTDAALGGSANGGQYKFDPTAPAAGTYHIGVLVSDGSLQATDSATIVISQSEPALSDDDDFDGDGINDASDGLDDSDGDGIRDYQDPVDAPTLLNRRVSASDDSFARLIRVQPGLSLKLGRFAIAAERAGARIAVADVTDTAGQTVADDGFLTVGGLYDFEVHGLSEMQRSATVVIPLTEFIPPNAVYRKFSDNLWSQFVDSGTATIRSAPAIDNECPPPGHDSYQNGLVAFTNCVQLTLTDGGPNDADGEANGIIRDPGGVAIDSSIPGSVTDDTPPPPTEGPEGGGSLGLLTLLALFSLWMAVRIGSASGRATRVLLVITAAMVFFPVTARPAESSSPWRIHAESGIGYEDNVGRAERERDIADDDRLRASFGTSWNHGFPNGNFISLRGFLSTEEFRHVRDLGHTSFGGQFSLRWRLDRGFFAPIYRFSFSVAEDQYDVAQRDNVNYSGQLTVSKRMAEHIVATVGLDYREEQSRGQVFDLERTRVFVNADIKTASGWDPYGTYSFVRGDVWSTAQERFCNGVPAADIFELIRHSTAIEPDEAFNNAYCGAWVAYRLDAYTNMLTIGINKKIAPQLALDISARQIEVNAVANEYSVTSANLSFLVRF